MKQNKTSKVWAISSLTTGVLGLLLVIMPYFALPLSIVAIVFYTKQKESAMSKAGLVLGIIGCVINSIMLFMVLVALLFANAFA
jgi:hypothetical protein